MELLAPAGSLEKLKYAIDYGADSVYAAGKHFGLRAKAGNLTNEELQEAVAYCHSRNRHLYVPINIFAHNSDFEHLPEYIAFLRDIGVDAVIVADPGVLQTVKEVAQELTIHLSTQANTTSYKAAEFWLRQGVKRIILARELSFEEIVTIKEKLPELELEIFVHGAMCISYSGRCLISAFLNARSANRGLCTHPCRWKYHLFEESRPNQFFPIEEDERGTYILNSKDLCLFEQLPRIMASGIDAVKIEGRMKSLYYVANTVRVYRAAIDLLKGSNSGELNKEIGDYLRAELDKASHRKWTTGFFGGLDNESQSYDSSNYIRDYQFLGETIDVEEEESATRFVYVNVRAKFQIGDEIELIFPDHRFDDKLKIEAIYDEENNLIEATKPNTIVKVPVAKEYPSRGIVRCPIA